MTDRQLATAIQSAEDTERIARAYWTANKHDLPEGDDALIVVRNATALTKALKDWLLSRARRAAVK